MLRTLCALLLTLVLAVAGTSWYMLSYSLTPVMRHSHNLPWRLERILTDCPQLRPWADSLRAAHALRDTFVTMPGGERHHARYIVAPQPTGRVAVVVHGYRDNSMGMMHIASIYQRMGYHVLLPDLRAHGLSEGASVGMGWRDRREVMRWMSIAARKWGGADTTRVSMALHGISMGAATVMLVSGERLPGYVRCVVEDCGYTSVWDQFAHSLREEFSLPPFPLLYTTSGLCRLRYGWTFGGVSPLEAVSRSRLPMLFIHGTADDFVPTAMVHRLYAAKPQPKALWLAPGSVHAMSFRDHPEEYERRVREFVGKYIQ